MLSARRATYDWIMKQERRIIVNSSPANKDALEETAVHKADRMKSEAAIKTITSSISSVALLPGHNNCLHFDIAGTNRWLTLPLTWITFLIRGGTVVVRLI